MNKNIQAIFGDIFLKEKAYRLNYFYFYIK